MKNSKLSMAMTMVIVLASVFSVACAQQGPRHRMMEEGGRGDGTFLNKIPDLTDAQREKLHDLRVGMQKEMLPLKNRLREKGARLKTLSTAEKVDMNDINKLIDEMGEIKTQMMKRKMAHHQKVRAELTEEQRVFFDSHPKPHRRMGHHGMSGKGK